MKRYLLAASLLSLFLSGCSKEEPILEGSFQVPAGFVVEPAADADQVGSLIQVTFDAKGRPLVSKERSHPTLLLDNDGDGQFETEQTFSDQVENCQGVFFDGSTLYAICTNPDDGEACLFRLPDEDGDGRADSREIVVQFTGPIGEHGPHDIRRAPDGSLTILVGNHTFVPEDRIRRAESPLADYQESQLLPRYMDARGHAVGKMAPGGSLFRYNEKEDDFTLLLGGFRNPYNHAYNWEGEAFTFDSDMEWDINLPWYRDVRSVHAVPGADYGWRTGSGKFPAYYLDSLPPVDDLGRGSPVGVDFYYHYTYPAEYFGAFLQGDWSRGRVVLSNYENSGATYKLAREAFDFIYGEPLNVTDVAVGPDGLVYFTMGGRDTQGGFYRVAYKGYKSNAEAQPTEGALAAAGQPQPFSAWGHQALLDMKAAMGDSWGPELQAIAKGENAAADSYQRVQALFLLQRFGPAPNAELLGTLLDDQDERIRAASVYVVGMHGSDRAKALAARGLKDSSPHVQRRAAESLISMGLTPDAEPFAPLDDVYALLSSDDRFTRYAGRLALENFPRDQWKAKAAAETDITAAPEAMVALTRTAAQPVDVEPVLEGAISLLKKDGVSADDQLRLMRAFHLACMELENGCRQSMRDQLAAIVADRFPASDDRLNREYARSLAYAGGEMAVQEILAAMPQGEDDKQLQIHYVYCLRDIKDGWDADQKKTLLTWFTKAKTWRGGSSFPGFMNRLFDSSLEFFDEAEKQQAYATIPEYAPIDDEALLAKLRNRRGYTPARVFARQTGAEGVSEQEIFEYLMYDPMTLKADPRQGKEIYEEQCSKCHRFGDQGKDYGPDLTTINNRFKRRDMIEAVLYPSKTISDQYDSYRIRVGYEVFEGLIMDQDDTTVTVLLPEEERPVKFEKSKVEIEKSDISIMPTGLMDGYSTRDMATLFAYLQQGPNLPATDDD